MSNNVNWTKWLTLIKVDLNNPNNLNYVNIVLAMIAQSDVASKSKSSSEGRRLRQPSSSMMIGQVD